jgi:hypothetical protein
MAIPTTKQPPMLDRLGLPHPAWQVVAVAPTKQPLLDRLGATRLASTTKPPSMMDRLAIAATKQS